METLKTSKNDFTWIKIITAFSLCAFLVYLCMGACLKIEFITIFKSAAMQIGGLFIPGMALYCLLTNGDQKNFFALIVLSYAFGYAFSIISYFLCVPFGIKSYIPYYNVLLCLAALFCIAKNSHRINLKPLEKSDLFNLLLFLFYFGLMFLAYSANHASPLVTNTNRYETDLLYWLENAGSLSRSFPPLEPRVSFGTVYHYHYFSSIQLAYLKLATGVDVFTLGVSFYTFGKCILFYGAFYMLFSGFHSKKVLFTGLVMMLFCIGFERMSSVTYFSHTWLAPFGLDIGLAYGALFIYAFFRQFNKAFNWRLLIQTLLFFGICVGSKAPIGAVVLVIPGVICFYWLFKKEFKPSLFYGFGTLAIFFIITIGCIGLFNSNDAAGMSHFSLDGLSRLHDKLLYSNPILMLLFAAMLVMCIFKREQRNIVNLSLILSGCFGFILGIFNYQEGYSEMYFIMGAFLPIACVDGFLLSAIFDEDPNQCSNILVRTLFAGIIVGQIYLMLFIGHQGLGVFNYAKHGLGNVVGRNNALMGETEINSLSLNDYVAMTWLRDNASDDSIVLSDRCVIGECPGYMYYGAFSETQQYIEGDIYFREQYVEERNRRYEVVRNVFSNDEGALRQAISENVDYIVQTKWLTPSFVADVSLTELVYSTDSINIYAVKR